MVKFEYNNTFDLKNSSNIPLYQKLRPETLKEVIGQKHLLDKGLIDSLVTKKELISIIFWGPPGTGKTTLSNLLAKECDADFVAVSAVDTSVSEVKDIVKIAERNLSYSKKTAIFMDEIHRFNTKQQDIFLPLLEAGTIILIGATTENPSFYLNKALLSRVQVLEMFSLTKDDLKELLQRAENYLNKKFDFEEDSLETLFELAQGDGRYLLNVLDILDKIYSGEKITIDKLKLVVNKKLPLYDKDKDYHYNLISALHKSVRGSDEQASLYWFYRMVEGGEDIAFIVRRLLRMSSEDVGLANPNAMGVVLNAYNIYRQLGDKEGILSIAEAVVYLALSPKSNRIYEAATKAQDLARRTSNVVPPKHILNSPTALMSDLGYGEGYKYDHYEKDYFSGQNYFPDGMKRQIFYEPTENGHEKELAKRISYLNDLRNTKNNDK